MRSFAAAVLAMAAWWCAGSASAQQGTYFGLGYGSVSYDREDAFPTAAPAVLAFKLGREINRNLAFEARAGFGVGDDTVSVLGVPVDVRIDHYFGLYGKGTLPLSESFSVYGLIGVIAGKVTARGFGYSASSSDTALSYGLGIDLGVSRHAGLTFEWVELFEGTGYQVEAASLGFVYRY